MIEASVATVCTKGMNSNPDFHHNPIVIGNLRLFENCHHGIFDRSGFCITNSPPLVTLARTRIYRKNRSDVKAAGVTMHPLDVKVLAKPTHHIGVPTESDLGL